MIRNIRELATELGVPSCFEGDYVKAVERYIFKYTECGCVFNSLDDGVTVAGYAEGADAECPDHYLKYPFEAGEFYDALAEADYEGVEMWREWNEDDDMQDIIDSDNRDRAADMNATLRGGW